MAELLVPNVDFSSLGQLPQLYKQGVAERGVQDAFAGGIGSDPQSLAALATRVGQHNPQLGMSLSQLAVAAHNKQADDAWRRQESQRAQSNADRSYGLQVRAQDRADDPTPAGFVKGDDGSVRPLPGGPADPSYIARKTAITAIPEGFQRDDATGGLRPIVGGPNDPAYLRTKSDKQNAPSGYLWNDPNNPAAGMTAIAGGPGEKVDAEVAGRLGLAKSFLSQLPEIKRRVDAGEATGLYDGAMGKAGIGAQGEIRRQIDSGAEALLRMLTGAGMNKEEAADYTRRYKMHPLDSAGTLRSKLDQLEKELNSVGETVGKGRGGWTPPKPTETAKPDKEGFLPPPKLGEARGGYRFKGGNPGDPANWAKAQDLATPGFGDRFDASFRAGNGS